VARIFSRHNVIVIDINFFLYVFFCPLLTHGHCFPARTNCASETRYFWNSVNLYPISRLRSSAFHFESKRWTQTKYALDLLNFKIPGPYQRKYLAETFKVIDKCTFKKKGYFPVLFLKPKVVNHHRKLWFMEKNYYLSLINISKTRANSAKKRYQICD